MAHNHQHSESNRGLKIALGLTTVIMVAEAVGGFFSNSLALMGDAGHMLVDVLALTISLIALNLAKRPATASRTFGFHRAEILAALANGIILVLVAAFVFYESIQRLQNPPEVHSGLMLIIAAIGLVANLVSIMLLRRDRHANINIRGAFLHIIGDTISSVGVIIAGIIVATTGFRLADPIVAILIGIIILFGAVQLVMESANILLESVPKNIPMEKVIEAIKSVESVHDLHDLHLWTITSGLFALSAHILVEDRQLSHTHEIVDKINGILAERFSITHTTLQIESERRATCGEGDVCDLSRPGQNMENHHNDKHQT
jgi:cobalt-zinc-cadmium efflux system protein